MLGHLAEAALRSLLLAAVVQCVLCLRRVRRADALLAAWTIVLVASVAMPMVQRVTPLQVPLDPALPQVVSDGASDLLRWPQVGDSPTRTVGDPEPQPGPVPWMAVAYLVIGAGLLLRVALGVGLSVRLLLRAVPIGPEWTRGLRVRISRDVTGPVTVAGVILLPVDAPGWPADTRRAVLAHEQAHVERRDFAMLLLSQLNRALFWFSPVPWWLHRRLVVLTELASDDRAASCVRDRVRYAEILLEMGRRSGRASRGLAMARPATLSRRIERMLRQQAPPRPSSTSRQVLIASGVVGLSLAAGSTMVRPVSRLVVGDRSETSDALGGASAQLADPRDDAGPMPGPLLEAVETAPAPQSAADSTAHVTPGTAPTVPRPGAAITDARPPAVRPPRPTTQRAPGPVQATTPAAPRVAAGAARGARDRGGRDGAARPPLGTVLRAASPEPGRGTDAPPPGTGPVVALDPLPPSVAAPPRLPVPAFPVGFRGVVGSTCQGTVAIGPNARSSPDNQPFVVPGQKVAATAYFHLRANGTAWVRFAAFGRQPLDLPVRFTRNGMAWTGEYGVAYTVQTSGDRGLTGLAGFFHNDSARLDLDCARSVAGES